MIKLMTYIIILHIYKVWNRRTTYDASQEIRNNHLNYERKKLIKKYDGEFPDIYFEEILSYLKIKKKDEFFKRLDKFRPWHFMEKRKIIGN